MPLASFGNYCLSLTNSFTYGQWDMTAEFVVVTDKPAVIISLASNAKVPSDSMDTWGDPIIMQVPPTTSLGKRHIIPPNEYETKDTATNVYFMVRVMGSLSEPTPFNLTYESATNGLQNIQQIARKGIFYEQRMTENVPVLVVCEKPCQVQ